MQTSQHEIQEAKTLLNQISFEKYKDLNHLSGDPYEWLENIKNRIKEHISEIIILKIEEDFITQNSLLPKELQRFKDFWEGRGFNYYILKT